ncbi:MAG: protease inhibitor I9 family protein, partial [Thermoplasmata archaeon]|nr:protease inhibitor I9 family protein [Thermoplasmata archaeon]
MTFLIRFKELLRAISIGLLALMLSIPAATALLGPTSPSDGDIPETTGSDLGPSGFWDVGGEHDVIVTFKAPCVVERRLDLEASGLLDPGTLARMSREYKMVLESDHRSFMEYLHKQFPWVAVSQEYTTVLNGLALHASSQALDWISIHPEVKAIEPDTEVSVALSTSVPLINADDMWNEQ